VLNDPKPADSASCQHPASSILEIGQAVVDGDTVVVFWCSWCGAIKGVMLSHAYTCMPWNIPQREQICGTDAGVRVITELSSWLRAKQRELLRACAEKAGMCTCAMCSRERVRLSIVEQVVDKLDGLQKHQPPKSAAEIFKRVLPP
jgi:hypothetical protein